MNTAPSFAQHMLESSRRQTSTLLQLGAMFFLRFSQTSTSQTQFLLHTPLTGNFHACIDSEFHGDQHINVMNITPVKRIPTAIDLAMNMRAHLVQLRTTFTQPFLVIIYEHRSLLRPATVWGHVPSFQPDLNYFNNTKVKIPKKGLFNIANHNCTKLHTQLIRFDNICCVCVGTTPAGNSVQAMKLVHTDSTNDFWVYDFKDTYASLFEQYKKTRVEVFGNYQI